MTNLTGYLKRILLLSSLFVFTFIFPTSISAQTGFNITTEFTHSVGDEFINTEVIVTLDSETDRVLTYYTATLPLSDIQPTCQDLNNNKVLNCEVYSRDGVTDIQIDTNNVVVRAEKPYQIKLTYSTEFTGEYNFTSYIQDTKTTKVVVRYPAEKGEPFWSSDTVHSLKTSGEQYVATLNNPSSLKTSFIFGNVVNYKYQISRVLNNTLTEDNQTFEILIPSDTTNQTIIFEEINPLPNTAIQDEAGNYVFKYVVQPESSLDVKISGYIQKAERETEEDLRQGLLTTTGYWDISEEEYENLLYYLNKEDNLTLPDNFSTVEDLEKSFDYDLLIKYANEYIKNRLDYDQEAELGIEGGLRLGAKTVSEKPYDLLQEDYADFSIAIYRKLGIPARMVVGYLSSVSGYTSDGYYHTWTEVYNQQTRTWQIIDPFLEDYTGNNLFGSEYLDHISILKRELSPTSPKLSFYESSDFQISYDQDSDIDPILKAEITLEFEENNLLNKYLKGIISYSNTGNMAITSYEILKSNFDADKYLDSIYNLESQIILPKQNGEIYFNLPTSLEEKSPYLTISLKNNNGVFEEYLISDEIIVKPNTFLSVLAKIISIGIFGAFIYLIYFITNKYFINRK
jgi:hypothetical protein